MHFTRSLFKNCALIYIINNVLKFDIVESGIAECYSNFRVFVFGNDRNTFFVSNWQHELTQLFMLQLTYGYLSRTRVS